MHAFDKKRHEKTRRPFSGGQIVGKILVYALPFRGVSQGLYVEAFSASAAPRWASRFLAPK
jgi:hypothetical protein